MRCILNNNTIILTKEKVICGIYKIECIITGCIYIGYTVNMYTRYNTHKRRSDSVGLTESLQQYGCDNHTFEIIHIVEKDKFKSKKDLVNELDRLEIQYIKKYNSYYKDNFKGLNRTFGGGTKSGRPTKAEKLIKTNEELKTSKRLKKEDDKIGIFIEKLDKKFENSIDFKTKLINEINIEIKTAFDKMDANSYLFYNKFKDMVLNLK